MQVIQASLKLKKENPGPENGIAAIVNVVEFYKRLSLFLSKYNQHFKIDYPEKGHKLFLKSMNDNYKLLKQLCLITKN